MFWNKPKTCEECEKLRRDFKQLSLDVEGALDKVYHWMKRHSARLVRDTAESGEDASTPEASPDSAPAEVTATRNGTEMTRAQRIARLNRRMGIR